MPDSTPRLSDDVAAEVSERIGRAVVRAEFQLWGSKNRTWIVTLDDDRRVVLQVFSDGESAARRIEASKRLDAAAGVPVPRILADRLGGTHPWAVSELIVGQSGYEAAGPDLAGPHWLDMAASMGRLLRRLQDVDVATAHLPSVWTRPDELGARAGEWSTALSPHLGSDLVRRRVARVIDSTPLVLTAPPVVCHGDFGPQNVLFEGTEVTGLLDLEDARIGPPLLDVAWWTWLVRAHTPAAFQRSWPAFVRGAGIDESTEGFEATLHTLTILRLLETADRFRVFQPEKYPSWAIRVEAELDRFGQTPTP